jgi:AMP-polyphosphate phosphotransferase
MFDSANLPHVIDKERYRIEEPALREALLNAQFDLAQQARFPVIIVIGGVEGAGKSEAVNILSEWMDPRHLHVHAFPDASDEERERPPMWRFWRALPPKGKIGILFGAWHTQPIVDRVLGAITDAELDQRITDVHRFERMLADEGALVLKFWFHITEKQQKKRLDDLASDPRTAWRVTEHERTFAKLYPRFSRVAERFTRATSTAEAPWIVVASHDDRYRNLTVGTTLLSALRARLDDTAAKRAPERTPPLLPPLDKVTVLRALKLDQPMTRDTYERELDRWQGRLALLSRDKRFKRTSVVTVFEGNDAAGKGGAIRRITAALDARSYQGVAIAAPTEEERAQPYLWRFWRHIPRHGRVLLFDRSWYGRVLVERVEGFCSEADWMRAYPEINDFEKQLVDHSVVVVKLWLAIDEKTQLARFEHRQQTAFKRFKITDEDWRNRTKWDAYETAVCDMIDRTSTQFAPWTLVEANNKYFARVKVLKTLVRAIERAFDAM